MYKRQSWHRRKSGLRVKLAACPGPTIQDRHRMGLNGAAEGWNTICGEEGSKYVLHCEGPTLHCLHICARTGLQGARVWQIAGGRRRAAGGGREIVAGDCTRGNRLWSGRQWHCRSRLARGGRETRNTQHRHLAGTTTNSPVRFRLAVSPLDLPTSMAIVST